MNSVILINVFSPVGVSYPGWDDTKLNKFIVYFTLFSWPLSYVFITISTIIALLIRRKTYLYYIHLQCHIFSMTLICFPVSLH